MNHGGPYRPRRTLNAEWFWCKVIRTNNCWEWMASTDGHFGYGQCKFRGTVQRAHRIAYTITYGEIPEGFCVLHHCDNPRCVNPAHLFLGSIAENNQDMFCKGRASGGSLKGMTNPRAKLSEENVHQIRSLLRGRLTYRAIGNMYGVERQAIKQIARGKYWKHLPCLS